MLREGMTPEEIQKSIDILKRSLGMVCEVGDYTQNDRKTNSIYATVIITINTLIKELKCLQ